RRREPRADAVRPVGLRDRRARGRLGPDPRRGAEALLSGRERRDPPPRLRSRRRRRVVLRISRRAPARRRRASEARLTRFADVRGRYVYLSVDGVEYRVYFEEAGEGIPVILQ